MKDSVWKIFFEGLKIYCLNIHKFILYMLFPVLGQVLGLFLIFGLTYLYTKNLTDITVRYPLMNNLSNVITSIVIMVIPGLLIFMKAFWDYLTAYSSLNSMTEGYLNTGKVYDFKAHNQIVSNKMFSFIALWFLFGIYTLVSVIPVFWILGFIFFIYFILIFQVFTFESGHSPIGYFKRSFEIIRGNFAGTFSLMLLLSVVCFYFLSAGLSVIFDYLNFTQILSKAFENWAFTLPLEPLEPYGVTPVLIGKSMVKQLVFFIMAGFTLPLRSICWTLWYKNSEKVTLVKPKKIQDKKKNSKSFKIEKREIDPEIIRRARLEDDEY